MLSINSTIPLFSHEINIQQSPDSQSCPSEHVVNKPLPQKCFGSLSSDMIYSPSQSEFHKYQVSGTMTTIKHAGVITLQAVSSNLGLVAISDHIRYRYVIGLFLKLNIKSS